MGHIVNNGQQWTTIRDATCICDAVFDAKIVAFVCFLRTLQPSCVSCQLLNSCIGTMFTYVLSSGQE